MGLALYFALHWAAVVLRIDRFPLSWAPMYSTAIASETIAVREADPERLARGLRATRQDGGQEWLDRHALNIPRSHFWRLYGQRMRGRGPIKHLQADMNLASWHRALRGLGPGERRFVVDWERRVLTSVNRTLGRRPGDPAFVVRLEAWGVRRDFAARDLAPIAAFDEHAVLTWDPAWAAPWPPGPGEAGARDAD